MAKQKNLLENFSQEIFIRNIASTELAKQIEEDPSRISYTDALGEDIVLGCVNKYFCFASKSKNCYHIRKELGLSSTTNPDCGECYLKALEMNKQDILKNKK